MMLNGGDPVMINQLNEEQGKDNSFKLDELLGFSPCLLNIVLRQIIVNKMHVAINGLSQRL